MEPRAFRLSRIRRSRVLARARSVRPVDPDAPPSLAHEDRGSANAVQLDLHRIVPGNAGVLGPGRTLPGPARVPARSANADHARPNGTWTRGLAVVSRAGSIASVRVVPPRPVCASFSRRGPPAPFRGLSVER